MLGQSKNLFFGIFLTFIGSSFLLIHTTEANNEISADCARRIGFLEDAKVSIQDESPRGYHEVSISSVRPGDTLMSCTLSAGGICDLNPVIATAQGTVQKIIHLRIEGKDLRATQDQLFYLTQKETWVEAQNLRPGDFIQALAGESKVVGETEIEEGDFTIHSLEVAGNHNYYAGGVLAHNCNLFKLGWSGTFALAYFQTFPPTPFSLSRARRPQTPIKRIRPGRVGREEKLIELSRNDKVSSADRGWIQQEINSIARGKRHHIRNPPGKELAHERGREAAKGYNYSHSQLQDVVLHRLQHKHDDCGKKNKERPIKK